MPFSDFVHQSVERGSAMPALAASFAWSISEKNRIPLAAMSASMRAIVSSTEYALLTRTTGSARARPVTPHRTVRPAPLP